MIKIKKIVDKLCFLTNIGLCEFGKNLNEDKRENLGIKFYSQGEKSLIRY